MKVAGKISKGKLYKLPEEAFFIASVHDGYLYTGTAEGAKKVRDELQKGSNIAYFAKRIQIGRNTW